MPLPFTQLMQETWDEAVTDMDERQRQLADSGGWPLTPHTTAWTQCATSTHGGRVGSLSKLRLTRQARRFEDSSKPGLM